VGDIENDEYCVRFDEACMSPMTAQAEAVRQRVLQNIRASNVINIDWRPRMLLIIDNRRMLHARGAAIREDADRTIKRILVGE
jgi:alpha-ketoglutarate-dependent taurine dioxygenase